MENVTQFQNNIKQTVVSRSWTSCNDGAPLQKFDKYILNLKGTTESARVYFFGGGVPIVRITSVN